MTREQQDAHFMELALAQAEAAVARGQTPFGAVLVDPDGRLIGEGHNTVRADRDPAAHGEVAAIRDAWRRVGDWRRLKGCTLYSSSEPGDPAPGGLVGARRSMLVAPWPSSP